MDQGLAAFYAGIGALFGAILTALAGYLGARHTAKSAVDAAAKQVAAQAANELTHWIRQERRQVYREVLTQARSLIRTNSDVKLAAVRLHLTDSDVAVLHDQSWGLALACTDVETLGGEEVTRAATELATAALRMAGATNGLTGQMAVSSTNDRDRVLTRLGEIETDLAQAADELQAASRRELLGTTG
ncbi:hypothetical protein [Streptomyces decoyicus]